MTINSLKKEYDDGLFLYIKSKFQPLSFLKRWIVDYIDYIYMFGHSFLGLIGNMLLLIAFPIIYVPIIIIDYFLIPNTIKKANKD